MIIHIPAYRYLVKFIGVVQPHSQAFTASYPGSSHFSAGEEPGYEARPSCVCRLQYKTMHEFCTASNEPCEGPGTEARYHTRSYLSPHFLLQGAVQCLLFILVGLKVFKRDHQPTNQCLSLANSSAATARSENWEWDYTFHELVPSEWTLAFGGRQQSCQSCL